MTAPPVLWRPTAERIERADADRLRALARGDARARAAGLREPVGVVDDRPRGLLGVDLGALRRGRVRAVRARARLAGDAGGGVVPRRAAQLRRARAASAERRPGRDPACVGAAAARRDDPGRAARRGGAARGGPARARRRAGRPGRRVPAEHPRGGRRVPRLRVDRRDLVELLAGLRRPQRDRPLRADRAEGAACVDGYRYGGKDFDRLASCSELLGQLPTVEHTVAARLPRPGARRSTGSGRAQLGGAPPAAAMGAPLRSSRCRSIIRSGCSTAPARRACRRRSCTAMAGSCSRR